MKKLIAFVLTATLLITSFALPSLAYNPYEGENEDGKVICNATLEDGFDDNVVAVEIKEEYSVINKVWTKADFGEDLPIAEIVDNTRADSEDVYKALMNYHPFRQALRLTLSVEDKQTVLDVIKELEKLDFIYYAHPLYTSYDYEPRVSSGNTDVIIKGKVNGETTAPLKKGDTFLVNWEFYLSDEMASNDDRVGSMNFYIDFDDSVLELVSQDEDYPDDPYYAFSDNLSLFSRSPYKYVGANNLLWNTNPREEAWSRDEISDKEYYKYVQLTPGIDMYPYLYTDDRVQIVKHDFRMDFGCITGIGYKVSGMTWFNMQFRVKENAPDGNSAIVLTPIWPMHTNHHYDGLHYESLNTEIINAQVVIGDVQDNSVLGDVNGDNIVSATDSLMILQHSVGKAKFTKSQFECADINVDRYVDSCDSLLALRESIKQY